MMIEIKILIKEEKLIRKKKTTMEMIINMKRRGTITNFDLLIL